MNKNLNLVGILFSEMARRILKSSRKSHWNGFETHPKIILWPVGYLVYRKKLGKFQIIDFSLTFGHMILIKILLTGNRTTHKHIFRVRLKTFSCENPSLKF